MRVGSPDVRQRCASVRALLACQWPEVRDELVRVTGRAATSLPPRFRWPTPTCLRRHGASQQHAGRLLRQAAHRLGRRWATPHLACVDPSRPGSTGRRADGAPVSLMALTGSMSRYSHRAGRRGGRMRVHEWRGETCSCGSSGRLRGRGRRVGGGVGSRPNAHRARAAGRRSWLQCHRCHLKLWVKYRVGGPGDLADDWWNAMGRTGGSGLCRQIQMRGQLPRATIGYRYPDPPQTVFSTFTPSPRV